ncbi:hypothetical protein [Lacticaseibacillus camelliae]|uniref:Uncharacterized protein n=1 Tax=Lacticaseibacillus camelliae DSM 22697 = JCM 13995 TaxID=1423730 RepID=A0A0R2FES6_9LACO|nr:hypothetical protein [Lacticaseibacillus camelliae]KRN25899.1 hypothetical protein FC75_GL002033 [Lacticaseibacillus camelliae DSM 22697 = JCM 13995]
MFEKFKANRIRHKGIRRAEKDLQNSGKTGLALYDFVQEYTGDPNPWIKNPYGFFNDYQLQYVALANQRTGSVAVLYSENPPKPRKKPQITSTKSKMKSHDEITNDVASKRYTK